jgi:hypothetical protein
MYDPVLERRVLMKDTWRVSLDGMQTEGAVYRRLHAANFRIFCVFSKAVMLPRFFAVLIRTSLLDNSVLDSDLIAIIG